MGAPSLLAPVRYFRMHRARLDPIIPDQEVVAADFFRAAFRTSFPADVLEVADEFLFLGADRDH
jgi:hypothetical protein